MDNCYVKNKVNFILWVLIVISALVAIISYSFLPKYIPMQWNGINVNWYANKLAIFLFPVICVAIIFLLKPIISIRFKTPVVSNIVIVSLIIVFLTCEIYTIAYCFGLRWRIDYILLVEFVSMLIIGTIAARRYSNK